MFLYMFWSTAYVLFVPIVLGAMTGYDSTSIAWIDLAGANNIVPAAGLQPAWVIQGTVNQTFPDPVCLDQNLIGEYQWANYERYDRCT